MSEPFVFVAVWAIPGDGSGESVELKTLGTVMNLEPSLFVYLAVIGAVGEVGDCAVCCLRFAGIPLKELQTKE